MQGGHVAVSSSRRPRAQAAGGVTRESSLWVSVLCLESVFREPNAKAERPIVLGLYHERLIAVPLFDVLAVKSVTDGP